MWALWLFIGFVLGYAARSFLGKMADAETTPPRCPDCEA